MIPPLKPPKLKKKLKDFIPVCFPIFDKYGLVYSKYKWPTYNGIFKEKVVIITNQRAIELLSKFGSFGQSGMFDKDTFIDYKTLQNQVINKKPNWYEMSLVPFEFPLNIPDEDIVMDVDESCQSSGESNTDDTIDIIKLLTKQNKETIYLYNQESNIKDNIVGGPVNWKDLKNNYTKDLENLLILSGVKVDTPYYLTLEEAFFLCYTIQCLNIYNDDEENTVMNVNECWEKFNSIKNQFPYYYAAYHYYRSRGWVVKPGHQYGGDYVLYKFSPDYYHSSFVVMININGQNNRLLSSWPSWFGSFRTIEATNKELIVCSVHGPEYLEGTFIDLTKYTITDTIVRRWVPSQNREKVEYELPS